MTPLPGPSSALLQGILLLGPALTGAETAEAMADEPAGPPPAESPAAAPAASPAPAAPAARATEASAGSPSTAPTPSAKLAEAAKPAEPPASAKPGRASASQPSGSSAAAAAARQNTAQQDLLHSCRLLSGAGTPGSIKQLLRQHVIELLAAGANPDAPDEHGNSARLYLLGDDDFTRELQSRGLLREAPAAERIPEAPAAFASYVQRKLEQWSGPLPAAAREQLRKNCLPAVPLALHRLDHQLRRPLTSTAQQQELKNLLRFLHLVDRDGAQAHIAALPLWTHAEHFIESGPGTLLEALAELKWPMPAEQLRPAIERLSRMLPASKDDMIDCNAALPLSQLLEMLYEQEGDAAWPTIEPYLHSGDPQMSCAAHLLELRHRKLPAPDEEQLSPYLEQLSGIAQEQLQDLILCCRVDRALTRDEPGLLHPDDLQQAPAALRDLGADAHARLIDQALAAGPLTEESWQLLRQQYIYLREDPPRLQAARFILSHPELFPPPARP